MNPTYDFKGQVALVTGASSGIGPATAQAFARSGAATVLADRNEQALKAATEALVAAGHKAIAVPCDVANETQAAALVERAVSTFGRLDMAYNIAGILGPMCPMTEETSEGFDEVNAVNLRGVWSGRA
jgi:NAD(P)-dependent dehydrogenase (short-subunit alcohol dehydrogenase family)